MTPVNYENQLVVITGGTSGVGFELAKLFLRAGAIVAIVGRNFTKIRQFKDASGKEADNLYEFPFDLTHTEEIPNLVNSIVNKCRKPIGVLVNNAAGGMWGFIEDTPISFMKEYFQTNFLSIVAFTQCALKSMKEQRRGQIINATSGTSLFSLPGSFLYSSAKATINSFTHTLRLETRKYNIDVILFSPGAVKTGFQRKTVHFGHGDSFALPDSSYSSPEKAAKKLFHIARNRKSVYFDGIVQRAMFWLSVCAPRIADRITLYLSSRQGLL